MTTYLVLGGTKSGKSARAETLAAASGDHVHCIVTGRADDAEMDERIEAHRRRRPDVWTVEETIDLPAALDRTGSTTAVIVDDLEGWLIARMTDLQLWTDADVAPLGPEGLGAVEQIVAEAAAWWETADRRSGDTIVIAGQPGAGIIPMTASTRRYVDLHGKVLQRLSAHAQQVDLMVAGRAIELPAPSQTGSVPSHRKATGSAERRGHDAPAHDPRDHGDRQVPPGTIDLAVNVLDGPPAWLRDRLADCLDDLAGYPDDTAARETLAARHGRTPEEIVPLTGAADGMWLLPRVLRPKLAACVHPGFTEPEAALRDADVPVVRVQRRPSDWQLDSDEVPEGADLVVLSRPDNPTGILDPVATVTALCRPGRIVVVDEAFAEFLPDAAGVAGWEDLPGIVSLRSYTKLWGLAGLRVGYLVAPVELATRLRAARQPWAVDRLALEALIALTGAEEERRRRAEAVAGARDHLIEGLRSIPQVMTWDAAANYVLLRTPRTDLRERLLDDGFAVRRCDNFPGLDRSYIRVAVRTPAISDQLVHHITHHLSRRPPT